MEDLQEIICDLWNPIGTDTNDLGPCVTLEGHFN